MVGLTRGGSGNEADGMIKRFRVPSVLAMLVGCATPSATTWRHGLSSDCAVQLRASGGGSIDRECLRLGTVALGMSHAEVKERLGSAELELREPEDCTNAIYVLNRDIMDLTTPEGLTPDRLRASTLRLIYRADHVAAVEADGVAAQDFGFGPIRVGDSARAVERAFGQPVRLSGQVWSYQSVLLLLDDEERKVEAIGVSEPGAFACLLPATFQISCDSETGKVRSVEVVRPPSDEIRLHDAALWPGTIMRLTRACNGRRSAPPRDRNVS